MVGTATANGCVSWRMHTCDTLPMYTWGYVGIILQGRGWCTRVPWGCLPFSRALSAGLIQKPPRRKLQPKEGSVLVFFAFIRNDSNSSEEERGLHKLHSVVGPSAPPAFAEWALSCLTSQSSPVVCYGDMASHEQHFCAHQPGPEAQDRQTNILKVETEAGDRESSHHAGHRQRPSCENGLFLLVVQQQVWQCVWRTARKQQTDCWTCCSS